MSEPSLIERITRSLAFMLRHQPEQFDLELDPHGFADVGEVVRALNERLGEPVHEADLAEAVRSGDRVRYEIRGDKIRALYGHSIPVEPGPASKPPDLLYVAIPTQDAERARRFGLRGGRRRFLHLALSEDDARESGRRSSEDYTVLTIRALDAWEEGVNFYDRQTLWLAEEVPTSFLKVGETFHDGRPSPFGEHDRRGSDPYSRSSRRSRRRGSHEVARGDRERPQRSEDQRVVLEGEQPEGEEAVAAESLAREGMLDRGDRMDSDGGQRRRGRRRRGRGRGMGRDDGRDSGRDAGRGPGRAFAPGGPGGPREMVERREHGSPRPPRVDAPAPAGSGSHDASIPFGAGVSESVPLETPRPPKPEPRPEPLASPPAPAKPAGSSDSPFGAGL